MSFQSARKWKKNVADHILFYEEIYLDGTLNLKLLSVTFFITFIVNLGGNSIAVERFRGFLQFNTQLTTTAIRFCSLYVYNSKIETDAWSIQQSCSFTFLTKIATSRFVICCIQRVYLYVHAVQISNHDDHLQHSQHQQYLINVCLTR